MNCDTLKGLLSLSPRVRQLGIHVAYTITWLENQVSSERAEEVLGREVEVLKREISSKYSLESLRNDPVVRAYRDFYWRIGIDPTKTRPSSEALVRRLLRGKFPRINPIVDAGNIASARTMVPIGLYDTRYYVPPLTLDLSRGGEVFEPIGGDKEVLEEGVPVLVDSNGTIMHLYPHRDSRRTMIRSDTREVLVVAAGVPRVSLGLVLEAVRETTRILGEMGWKYCEPLVVG